MKTSKAHPVEVQLLESLNLKRRLKEPTPRFLGRVLKAANALTEEQWDELSSEAQAYLTAAIDAANEGKSIPTVAQHFGTETSTDSEEGTDDSTTDEEASDEAEDSMTKTKKKKSKKATDETAAPTKIKKKVGRKPTEGARGESATQKARLEVIRNPSASREELEQILDKKGIEVSSSTLTTVLFHTRATMAAMKEARK